jgi:release factor glutamine methyltransferase
VKLDRNLHISVDEGVYPPSDDSYFLIHCITVGKEHALDMGTGTGIIALHMAKHGAIVTAADNDQRAVHNTCINAEINDVVLTVVQSDLFSNIEGLFDVIVFNPPYLPHDEITDATCDGGAEGIEIAENFLMQAQHYLKPTGRIYLLLSTLGNIKKCLDTFDSTYTFRALHTLPLFFEKLVVYEVTH